MVIQYKKNMGYIRINNDNTGFLNKKTNDGYIPFGCNYFDPLAGWDPKIWEKFDMDRIEIHFQQMKELGVNTVRVFVSIASFMNESGSLSDYGMERSDLLIDIAARNDIRVEFAGPSNWEGYPDWTQKYFMNEPNAYFINKEWMDHLEQFWFLFAAHYKEEPAVFSYDLVNEPWLYWDSPLIRKLWGSIPIDEGDNNSQQWNEFQKFRVQLTREWASKMVGAIRSADTNHMITIGFHQESLPDDASAYYPQPGFSAKFLSDLLDYVALHWYPYMEGKHIQPNKSIEELSPNIAMIRKAILNANIGRPFTIVEFGWYGGDAVSSWERQLPYVSEEMQAEWCRQVIENTRDIAAGWLTWGYADVPDSLDITKKSGLVDEQGSVKKWGDVFRELSDISQINSKYKE